MTSAAVEDDDKVTSISITEQSSIDGDGGIEVVAALAWKLPTEEEDNSVINTIDSSSSHDNDKEGPPKRSSTKRLMLHDDNIVTPNNNKSTSNKMRTLPTTTTTCETSVPITISTDSSSSGGSATNSASDDFDGREIHDSNNKPPSWVCCGGRTGRPRCLLRTVGFIGLCFILGTIVVVSLHVTENLGQGQKGLIASGSFQVTSSPSPAASPSRVPSGTYSTLYSVNCVLTNR